MYWHQGHQIRKDSKNLRRSCTSSLVSGSPWHSRVVFSHSGRHAEFFINFNEAMLQHCCSWVLLGRSYGKPINCYVPIHRDIVGRPSHVAKSMRRFLAITCCCGKTLCSYKLMLLRTYAHSKGIKWLQMETSRMYNKPFMSNLMSYGSNNLLVIQYSTLC